mgnify:CR=1 FL=1
MRRRDEASALFYKCYFDLESKREKAVASGEYLKLLEKDNRIGDLSRDDLTKNKIVCKYLLYSDEAAKLMEMQKFFGYLNNQVVVEGDGFRDWKVKRYIRAFTELSNMEIEQLTESLANYTALKEGLYGSYEAALVHEERAEREEPVYNQQGDIPRHGEEAGEGYFDEEDD